MFRGIRCHNGARRIVVWIVNTTRSHANARFKDTPHQPPHLDIYA
ncbi:hypothetical protein CKA32_003330 [Geitlerinema sp. FC II]|nr:hypothetical protein CKA32_003330 [Geitlerinema sp. FC II]